MSEQTIAEGIQGILQEISGINDSSITLSDWAVQDGSFDNAPFIRIDVAEAFSARQDNMATETEWEIPVTILINFEDWDTSHLELRNVRQSIIDKFNEQGTNRAAGLDQVDIVEIRSTTDIEPVLPEYQEFEDADPIFLAQVLIFEVMEHG